MLDHNAFCGENNWIHVLGISPVKATFAYTSLQHILRKILNNNLQITYDSSSPLQMLKYGLFCPHYTITPTRTQIEILPYFKNEDFDPEMDFPFSNIKRKFKSLTGDTKHGVSPYGYFYGMAVTTLTYLEAEKFAINMGLLPRAYRQKVIERKWTQIDEIIEEYLTSDKPDLVFKKHKIFLSKIVLDTPDNNNNILKSDLFSKKEK
jgi:hypothetical protein